MRPERSDHLRPCPFCGGQAALAIVVGGHAARCVACEALGPWADNAPQAVANWNQRPPIVGAAGARPTTWAEMQVPQPAAVGLSAARAHKAGAGE
jgi:hypothetical protein